MNMKLDRISQKSGALSIEALGKNVSDVGVEFQSILNDAMSDPKVLNKPELMPNLSALPVSPRNDEILIAQGISNFELEEIERRRRRDRSDDDSERLTVENINELGFQTTRLEVTPFQLFLDRAVDSLESISQMEHRVNELTQQYIEGKASIDEVSMETTKLNLAITFATTIITTASQTFKEFTQMAI
jgi:hypothetical protein